MTIFVARHGETQWNVDYKVCGRTDVPLTDRGREQAVALAQEAAGKGIEVILASPMVRAYETARAVSEAIGVPILTDERLMEQDYGIYEGVRRDDPGFLENKRHFTWRYPGGESMMDLGHRVYAVLDEVKERYAGKTVLLVCHGAVCRAIHSYFHDMTNEEYFHFNMENARLAKYETGV